MQLAYLLYMLDRRYVQPPISGPPQSARQYNRHEERLIFHPGLWGGEERAVLGHVNDQKCCLVALCLNISLAFLSRIFP